MRIFEILAEISAGEKARRAKLSAQSKRAAAAIPASPVRKKGIPDNVPPKSHYITNAPLKKQKDIPGAFAGSEFDQFREPKVDPNEHKGVVLRFHIENNPKTGNSIVHGYWAHNYAPDYNDCKALGTVRALGELYSHSTVDLIKELIAKEHAVHVLIDPQINTALPKPVRLLQNWVKQNADNPEFNGGLNFEIDDSEHQVTSIKKLVNVPTADVRIPNAEILSAKIIQQIRRNTELDRKYKSVTSQIRSRALNAGVSTLYKTKDMEAALDDVDVALD